MGTLQHQLSNTKEELSTNQSSLLNKQQSLHQAKSNVQSSQAERQNLLNNLSNHPPHSAPSTSNTHFTFPPTSLPTPTSLPPRPSPPPASPHYNPFPEPPENDLPAFPEPEEVHPLPTPSPSGPARSAFNTDDWGPPPLPSSPSKPSQAPAPHSPFDNSFDVGDWSQPPLPTSPSKPPPKVGKEGKKAPENAAVMSFADAFPPSDEAFGSFGAPEQHSKTGSSPSKAGFGQMGDAFGADPFGFPDAGVEQKGQDGKAFGNGSGFHFDADFGDGGKF